MPMKKLTVQTLYTIMPLEKTMWFFIYLHSINSLINSWKESKYILVSAIQFICILESQVVAIECSIWSFYTQRF